VLTVIIEPEPGVNLEDLASEVVTIAQKLNCVVVLRFGGQNIEVHPTDTVETTVRFCRKVQPAGK
jgi:hypothetical protein